jgi:SMI1-KNR4 cell-wall
LLPKGPARNRRTSRASRDINGLIERRRRNFGTFADTVGIAIMDRRKHISALSPDVEFSPPARQEEIRNAEAKLDVVFPNDLTELLGQSNGLAHRGASFVWSADEIVKQNLEMRSVQGFRTLFMPFDTLLFFGDDANSDLFFIPILDGETRHGFVFRWDHETDSRISQAHNLQTFVDKFIAMD